MNLWGVGGKLAIWSFLFSLPVLILAWLFHSILIVSSISPCWFYGASALLIAIGAPFLIMSARTMQKYFTAGKLCTTGAFGLCRNPLYAAWILFLIPGILLPFRIPLLLVIPIIMYALLRCFISAEEEWLKKTFGNEYMEYLKTTNCILPGVHTLLRRNK
jgi:protein-S-isoprenylcysteine O-methyltransferase Ste14